MIVVTLRHVLRPSSPTREGLEEDGTHKPRTPSQTQKLLQIPV